MYKNISGEKLKMAALKSVLNEPATGGKRNLWQETAQNVIM